MVVGILGCLLVFSGCQKSDDGGKDSMDRKKIIIDTDLTWMEDDTLMVFAMLQADAAKKVGRTDIKVYPGTDVPLAV